MNKSFLALLLVTCLLFTLTVFHVVNAEKSVSTPLTDELTSAPSDGSELRDLTYTGSFEISQNAYVPNSFISFRTHVHMNTTNWPEIAIKGLFEPYSVTPDLPMPTTSLTLRHRGGDFKQDTSIFVYVTVPDVRPNQFSTDECKLQNCKYPGTVFELKINQNYSIITWNNLNFTSAFKPYFATILPMEYTKPPKTLFFDIIIPADVYSENKVVTPTFSFELRHKFYTTTASNPNFISLSTGNIALSVPNTSDFSGFSASIAQFKQVNAVYDDRSLEPLVIDLMTKDPNSYKPRNNNYPSMVIHPISSMMTTAFRTDPLDAATGKRVKVTVPPSKDVLAWTTSMQLPTKLYSPATIQISYVPGSEKWSGKYRLETGKVAGYLLPSWIYYQSYDVEGKALTEMVRYTSNTSSDWDRVDGIKDAVLPPSPSGSLMLLPMNTFVREVLVSHRQNLLVSTVTSAAGPIELSTRIQTDTKDDKKKGKNYGLILGVFFGIFVLACGAAFCCSKFLAKHTRPFFQTFFSSSSSSDRTPLNKTGGGGDRLNTNQDSAYLALNEDKIGLNEPSQLPRAEYNPYQVAQPQQQNYQSHSYQYQTQQSQYGQGTNTAGYQAPGVLPQQSAYVQSSQSSPYNAPQPQSTPVQSSPYEQSPYPSQQPQQVDPYEGYNTPPQHGYEAPALVEVKDAPPVYASF